MVQDFVSTCPFRAGHLRVLGMLWVPLFGQPALLMAQGIFPGLPGHFSWAPSREACSQQHSCALFQPCHTA